MRLDTDAVAGNGGTTTETWVAVGPSTMTAADYATAQAAVMASVFFDPASIA